MMAPDRRALVFFKKMNLQISSIGRALNLKFRQGWLILEQDSNVSVKINPDIESYGYLSLIPVSDHVEL